jgi:hypothetical protein
VTSIVPELATLQRLAGPGVCAFCLRPMRRKPGRGRKPVACWSADCRTALDILRGKARHARGRRALAGLHAVVAALGYSTRTLARLIGAP